MVTRGDKNWEQHKLDIVQVLRGKGVQESKIRSFMELYASRYDPFRINYLSWKLCWALGARVRHLKNNSVVIVCVGEGGTGKSTLMINVLYFLTGYFPREHIVYDTTEFVQTLNQLEKGNGVLVDEPDDTFPAISKEGKLIRSITGKFRQHGIVMGSCATDLPDIPSYIWKKAQVVFFTPYLGKTIMYENNQKRKWYPVQVLRNAYKDKQTYNIFYDLEGYGKKFDTCPFTHIKKEEMEKYVEIKFSDYKDTMKRFIASHGDKDSKRLARIALQLKNRGIIQEEIGNILNVSQPHVSRLLKEDYTKE